MSENKWKDRLFASSLPLEFEVAKHLANKEYDVEFNYSYMRLDNAEQKEFSVDILASVYFPFDWDSKIKMSVDLLVECKYRNPFVSWLFVPEINCEHLQEIVHREIIRYDDAFTMSYNTIGADCLPNCESALKAMEINTKTGEVHDSDITHGTYQLIYALPHLLKKNVSHSLYSAEESHPYLLCPILVTTAKLMMLNDDFSIEALKSANNLESISTERRYVKLSSSLPSSFSKHCSNLFSEIPNSRQIEKFKILESYRKIKFDKKLNLLSPIYTSPASRLADYKLSAEYIYSSILICNLDHLPKLIQDIEEAVTNLGNGLQEVKND